MIIVKLQDILNKEERSLNWVSKKTNIAYSTLYNFNNNTTTSVSYNVLDKICKLFKCELKDIIEFRED